MCISSYLNQFSLAVTLQHTMTTTGRQRLKGRTKTKVSKRASRRGRGLSDSTTSAAPADAAGPTHVVRPHVCRIQRRAVPRRVVPCRAGAAEGKNKVGVSRPRYVSACTRQREIRGHKPAYYAPPRATNTPNNGRGSARRSKRRSGRYVRPGIVLNYNNSGANY